MLAETFSWGTDVDMYGKRRRQEREVTVPVNVAVPAVIAVLTQGKFRCVIVSCTWNGSQWQVNCATILWSSIN